MTERKPRPPPRWLLAVVMAGSFLACGIYLGLIKAEGAATGDVVRVAVYGAVGFLMLLMVMGNR